MTKKQKEQLMEECLRLREARNTAYIEGVKHNIDRKYLQRVEAFVKGDSSTLTVEDIPKIINARLSILKGIGA